MQIVPLDLKSDEQELKAFNVRMDDLYAIDLTFLQGFDQPTLAYLAEVRLLIHVRCTYTCVCMHVLVQLHMQAEILLFICNFCVLPKQTSRHGGGCGLGVPVSTSKLLDYPLFPQGKYTDGLLGPNVHVHVALYLYMYISVCECAL